ncbi:FG-GAP-like repeat-containing protein [Breoghania sp. L-A4]|uniref:FG-GAP-like repeat-containing protein n=1 Tax=Breoghania sp. L-A4 TaxID=2304600 RepID=UPI000E35F3AC|nr:FG-GAP-like repeat-containing protein [Breoghania sp. L-A4]AXS39861.1 RNA-binding protein [Breoghania sp. L-A4]
MELIVLRPFGKRFVLALMLVAVLAVQFWTQSRYPALNEKAMMSGAIQLEDPLGFEAWFPLSDEDTTVVRIGKSTLNWIKTNKRGMTFGILFAAAFLTLLGYLRRHSFKGSFSNSALGLVMGAPLGVCVNCAAPIARGLYSGGARAESTLSAMLASPTLNIVVLTMLFSLFPFYMAVTKIVLSLLMILVAVPIICRFLPKEQLQAATGTRGATVTPDPHVSAADQENVFWAVLYFVKDFAWNLWFILKTTLPLMLLAGFLGALVATLLPSSLLENAGFGLFGLIGAAVIGTFLPVPIGLDVVASGALLQAGLAPGYVMALLFTLGIFSIYSFFIVATAISLRAGLMLTAVIAIVGMLAGFGVSQYHDWQTQRALKILTGWEFSLIGSAHADELDPFRMVRDGDNRIALHQRPFQPRSPAAETPFTRTEAWHLGIDKPVEFSFADMWPPFWEGRSIASGDFDRDGDIDLVLASTVKGLYFYANDGAGKFEPVPFPIGGIADMPVFNAVLVDVDNDGWLDLFLATYQQGNYLLRNVDGRFDVANMTPVKNREDAPLSLALSFADVDRDGDLDAALGNWAAGWYRRIPGEEARNRIVFNEDGALTGERFTDLPGLPGETLSILLSDINADGAPDLLVGNDFEQPDIFYYGDGKGGFEPIRRQDGVVPMTTTTTMSIKTADLGNRGGQDIYVAQIAGRSSGVSKTLKMRDLDQYCDAVERDGDKATCATNMAIKTWYKSGHSFNPGFAGKCQELSGNYQTECKAMLVKDLAIQNRDPAICALIQADQVRVRHLCDMHFKPFRKPTEAEMAETIPQILRRNVLLSRQEDGSFVEGAEAAGLGVGGWSWDTKVADVDNDGWQDIYIVNGTWVPNEVSPSNLFFRNKGDGTFEEASGPFGLEDYLITAAAASLDIDDDGDLDFITVPVNGPVMAFVNNSAEGNAIAFSFSDHIGNRFGVGNKVEIRYGPNGEQRQTREIQLGGGFMSFDASVAHFGLGDADRIDSVAVTWADGGRTVIDGGLPAGSHYRIERRASTPQ